MTELPSDVHKLRSSERSTFKRCPQQWHWAYVEGLVSTQVESIPLWFGTGMHLAWAEYYVPGTERGRNPHDTWDQFCEGKETDLIKIQSSDEEHEKYVNAVELGHLMIDAYIDEYKGDPNWEVLAPEQRVRAIIAHPKDATRPYVDMVGTMDLIVRDLNDGRIWIVDHKHMAALRIAHLDMDEQLGGYVTIGEHSLRSDGIIGKNERVAGIIYNVLVKSKPDTRPRDPEGRYRNQPQKAHYVSSLIDLYVASGDAKDFADDAGISEEAEVEKETKRLSKMKLVELEEEAKDLGLTVFGDISKVQGSKKLHREPIPINPSQRRRQLKRIGEDMFIMNAVRSKKLPLMKSPGEHCTWCQFRDLCLLDEQGGDTEEFKRSVFNKQDPYADHREGAENSKTSVLLKRKTGVK